jgi:DNA segregation ATPase FtsK/SpoIIIE, S-DNA-T family
MSLFLGISLFSHSPADPSLNQLVDPARVVANQGGVAGAYLSGFLVDLFGLSSFVLPAGLFAGALACVVTAFRPRWWRWAGIALLFLCLATALESTQARIGSIQGGGLLGNMLVHLSLKSVRSASPLLWLMLCLIGVQLTLGLCWTTTAKQLKSYLKDFLSKHRERASRKQKVKASRASDETLTEPAAAPRMAKAPAAKKAEKTPAPQVKPVVASSRLPYPPVDILSPVQESRSKSAPERLGELSRKVEACLADFGIQGEVQRVQPGPVVTMFEFKPAPGIKISRIAGLSDDLALALKALAVRIVAPLPGKDTVGIEVPNEVRQTVYLREIIESDTFQGTKFRVPLALGKDIQGQPRIADLARMPHLLVAGATGAGKSVCLNSLVLSMLFKAGPDRLKMLMIDPKRIELAVYGALPHLVHPVVTEMSLAKNALDWAVHEMDQRYEAMARVGVRNIDAYNQRLERGGFDPTDEDGKPMPYLVIIIDELADLMLTAAKEVEVSIVRLAQLARAAGIHMILATQRPSVDVVTGLIKANFPCRIGFQVSSKHDSRTILDTVGAEHLLGLGDMLFKGGAGKFDRIHGTYVSDEEIGRMVEFWSGAGKPEFELDFTEWKKENGTGGPGNGEAGDIAGDPLYAEAVDFVHEQGKASISFIQRRFRIGFNKAARFIEQMEQDGIIGPQEGSRPRQILRK